MYHLWTKWPRVSVICIIRSNHYFPQLMFMRGNKVRIHAPQLKTQQQMDRTLIVNNLNSKQ